MTKIGKLLGAAALVLAFGTASAMAQTPAPSATPAAKAAPAAPAKSKLKLKAPTTAAGKACSDQADAKGLHGKERRTFRATCKKGMAKS